MGITRDFEWEIPTVTNEEVAMALRHLKDE
jgi:hypothetical protein